MNPSSYDRNGNIVILSEEQIDASTPTSTERISRSGIRKTIAWNEPKTGAIHTKEPIALATKKSNPTLSALNDVSEAARRTWIKLLSDIARLPQSMRASVSNVLKIASAPVTLKGKRKTKTRTKAQLFLTDVVRFGATFAVIFGVLFVGMNYQSFLAIARAELALGVDTVTTEALDTLGKHGSVDLGAASHAYGTSNILQYLPEVGPEENRLVIPKIGKNVPIVVPSMENLMKQNWKGFEEDIQEALKDGIVHYPGSARPGQAGNFFLTGHSSYYGWAEGAYKEVFARLHELDIGDTFFVYSNGDKHNYRVTQKYEVSPNNVSVLDQPTDKRISTLMTCTPVGTAIRRLIVQAEAYDPVTGLALAVGEKVAASEGSELYTGLTALPI